MTTQTVLDFLLTRRSRPARLLQAPVPDRARLTTLLAAAARVPDHGKLEPWRFIVLERAALQRLATEAEAHGQARGMADERIAKGRGQFERSPLCVAVIASPRDSARIPEIEQTLSAGAVCLSLVNAALADGWGASWLTGWVALDAEFAGPAFDLAPGEWVAGLIHIGTCESPPPERERPDLTAITTWIES